MQQRKKVKVTWGWIEMENAEHVIKKKIQELEKIEFKDKTDEYARDYAVRQIKDILQKIKFLKELQEFKQKVADDKQRESEKE